MIKNCIEKFTEAKARSFKENLRFRTCLSDLGLEVDRTELVDPNAYQGIQKPLKVTAWYLTEIGTDNHHVIEELTVDLAEAGLIETARGGPAAAAGGPV